MLVLNQFHTSSCLSEPDAQELDGSQKCSVQRNLRNNIAWENLDAHERSASEAKIYKCRICEASSFHASFLWHHRIVHMQQKPFICKFCSRNFPESSVCEDINLGGISMNVMNPERKSTFLHAHHVIRYSDTKVNMIDIEQCTQRIGDMSACCVAIYTHTNQL